MRSLWLRTRLRHLGRASRKPGRILAVKWGLNPNSSSLGVDVTFLLFGATALSLATPVIAALLRWRKPALDAPLGGDMTTVAGDPAADRDAGRGDRP
ncbi:MAG TPA: hypothetical protein VNM90_27590 [Haliangium sp.]|nr:hypothetical protein [Haliangium sp.]